MDQGLLQTLQIEIDRLPVIDCHEHTFLPEQRPEPVDLWTLIRNSDVGDDLISAGMPAARRSKLGWEDVAPFLNAIRNTGFYRSLLPAFRDLFGFEGDLTAQNCQSLSDRIREANAEPDWYQQVLQEKSGIRRILRVQGDESNPYAVDRRLFAPLIKVDDWIMADAAERDQLAAMAGGAAGTLRGYLRALEAFVSDARERGAAGLKSMLPYVRTLAHERTTRDEVERFYRSITWSPAQQRTFQDYILHVVAAQAGSYNLPLQMHIGYGSWQTNITARANPLLLNSLFEAHRQTRFVLLHGGYPYIGEMATLGKNHPNVYLECGWLTYIAPSAFRRAMGEWLDSVPANKLLAFSADCLHVEQTYGALVLSRRLLAQTLAEKVMQDEWSEALACTVARWILHDAPAALYPATGG